MRNISKRFLVRGGLTVGVALFAWGSWALLTPRFGRIVGYANAQPPLRLIQPDNPAPPAQVEHIRQLAMLHLDYKPQIQKDYWPEPSVITEREHCWLITFARKIPIYRWLGFEEVVRPVDQVMFLTIDKADERTRFGRWCD